MNNSGCIGFCVCAHFFLGSGERACFTSSVVRWSVNSLRSGTKWLILNVCRPWIEFERKEFGPRGEAERAVFCIIHFWARPPRFPLSPVVYFWHQLKGLWWSDFLQLSSGVAQQSWDMFRTSHAQYVRGRRDRGEIDGCLYWPSSCIHLCPTVTAHVSFTQNTQASVFNTAKKHFTTFFSWSVIKMFLVFVGAISFIRINKQIRCINWKK